jgi:hypothetical protein
VDATKRAVGDAIVAAIDLKTGTIRCAVLKAAVDEDLTSSNVARGLNVVNAEPAGKMSAYNPNLPNLT